jgi:hypothetical protein
MEDELFEALYHLVREEAKRRPRQKRVQYSDAVILMVALWAVLHDRPMCWACQKEHWPDDWPWLEWPSPSRFSERLRTLSVQLLLEQVFYRLLGAAVLRDGFCFCRRLDSRPLPVGGFSKDHDARWGYATGGKYRGYKLFGCWGHSAVVPETLVLGPMNRSDQAGGIELIDRLDRLYGTGEGHLGGYVLADATHDTNPLHECAGGHGLQLLAPRKEPFSGLGHGKHSPYRLRNIELLEGPSAAIFGRPLYTLRGQIERDFGQMSSFGGGLQPLPAWVRRPHRVAFWVIGKLIFNGLRILKNHGLTT